MRTSMSPASVRAAVSRADAARIRKSALRGAALNTTLILVLAYDLSCKCPGYMSLLHYVELVLAAGSCASLARHLLCLVLRGTETAAPPPRAPPPSPSDAEELPLSPRAPRPLSASPRPDPPSPITARALYEPTEDLIATKDSLDSYLKEYKERCIESPAPEATMSVSPGRSMYCAALEAGPAPAGGGAALSGGGATRRPASPPRQDVPLPAPLIHQYTLNMRLWIQVTILERLVRQLDELDDAFAKMGLANYKLGEVSYERLVGLCGGGWRGLSGLGGLAALAELLRAAPDQRYLVMRIRELSVGGCLRDYRWNYRGPLPRASPPRLSDAELILQLFTWYLDLELAPPARRFSSCHVSLGGAAPQPAPGALVIHRTSQPGDDPHFVVVDGLQTVSPPAGRLNLLSCLCLVVLACARSSPPALHRAHLGRAGLNLLWVVQRPG